MHCIQSQAWYSMPMLVLNLNFDYGSELPRQISVVALHTIQGLILNTSICCAVFCVLSGFAIILLGKRELVA